MFTTARKFVNVILYILTAANIHATSAVIVIAHRGASGYLPEHTLPAKALAYAQGADYIEQDVVLSKDNIPIVIHDIYLDEVTNVAHMFPNRSRSDGRFYAIDFTATEITNLAASERFNRLTGESVFAQRFPINQSRFHLVTLAEELEFIAGLNRQAAIQKRAPVGVYVEIKEPAFHQRENRMNMSEIVLDVLRKYNYTSRNDSVFLQCFDIDELQRIRFELQSDLKLVGLLTFNQYRSEYTETDYTYWNSEIGIEDMSRFLDGIGPHYSQLVEISKTYQPSKLLQDARQYKLFVHPYTFRSDWMVGPFSDFNAMLSLFIDRLEIDGLFIDQPDIAVRYLKSKNELTNTGTLLGPQTLLVFVICLMITE